MFFKRHFLFVTTQQPGPSKYYNKYLNFKVNKFFKHSKKGVGAIHSIQYKTFVIVLMLEILPTNSLEVFSVCKPQFCPDIIIQVLQVTYMKLCLSKFLKIIRILFKYQRHYIAFVQTVSVYMNKTKPEKLKSQLNSIHMFHSFVSP